MSGVDRRRPAAANEPAALVKKKTRRGGGSDSGEVAAPRDADKKKRSRKNPSSRKKPSSSRKKPSSRKNPSNKEKKVAEKKAKPKKESKDTKKKEEKKSAKASKDGKGAKAKKQSRKTKPKKESKRPEARQRTESSESDNEPDVSYYCHQCQERVEVTIERRNGRRDVKCQDCEGEFVEEVTNWATRRRVGEAALARVLQQQADFFAHLMAGIAGAMHPAVDAPRPTDPNLLENLPDVKVTAKFKKNNPHCVICHGGFKLGGKAKKLPCDHVFHRHCIKPWLKDHSTCPTCRFQLEAAEEESEDSSSSNRGRFRFFVM